MGLEPGRPELYSTRTRSAWRLPALALVAVLAAVVVITRLGGSDRPTGLAASATATPQPTVALPRPWSTPSFDPNTYADGIPLRLGAAPVVRVRDAVESAVGDVIQVGGWYIDKSFSKRECMARRGAACAPSTISDVPLVGPRVGDVITSFITIDSFLGSTGAYVVLAEVRADPQCWIHSGGKCQPELHVIGRLWSGLG